MATFLRHLKAPTLSAFAFICANGASVAHSGTLNAAIAPQVGTMYLNETRKSSPTTSTLVHGYRYSVRVDFMSLSNNVSMNLTSGFGADYNDFGLQIRLYDLLQLGRTSASGLYYGAGVGASYSPGFKVDPALKSVSFIDGIATAYLRLQWDTTAGFGFFTEVAYEAALSRYLNTTPSVQNTGTNSRFVFNFGVPIGVDFF